MRQKPIRDGVYSVKEYSEMSDIDTIKTDENHGEPVLIYEPSSQAEAEVVYATLVAAGIKAFLDHPDASPVLGSVDTRLGSSWRRGLFVFANEADAARLILADRSVGDEALQLEEEADTSTMEQAEARANKE